MERLSGELKIWRLVWYEEVDKNLTSKLNCDVFKSLDIETKYKACISKVKIVIAKLQMKNVNCKLQNVSLQNSSRTLAEAAVRRWSSK